MAYPINFYSLPKAELIYEIELRGITPASTVALLRKQLSEIGKEHLSSSIPASHLDPEDDLKGVRDTLFKCSENLILLKDNFDTNLYLRTESLLHHVYHRLSRMDTTSFSTVEDFYETKKDFNTQFKDLSCFKVQYEAAVSASTSNNCNQPVINVTCERSLNSELSKIKFNGETCVRAFIQHVDEFVVSRNISYEKILSNCFDIFTGDALHWYRSVKDGISSWSELTTLLKADFSIHDYDYRLMEEIRSRTQGVSETITIYLAIMHGMFSRLSKPLSEESKLEILLHNIRPCYASTLASSAVVDINSLKSACKSYEIIQSRIQNFREPPCVTSRTIAPEFAYKPVDSKVGSNSKNFNKYFTPIKPQVSAVAMEPSTSKKYIPGTSQGKRFCPRCRTNTHILWECKEPRTILCFRCGKIGFRSIDCPACKSKSSETPKNL